MCLHGRERIESMYVYHMEENFHMVQNFALFADELATAKIRTVKVAIATNGRCDHVYVGVVSNKEDTKIKTIKISSGGITGESLHQRKVPAIILWYVTL